MSDLSWKTSITKIGPNEVRLRGYRVDELMGQISMPLLDVLKVPSSYLPDNQNAIGSALDNAEKEMQVSGLPYAFVMKKGIVEKNNSIVKDAGSSTSPQATPEGSFTCSPERRMPRMNAIKAIREELLDNAAVVACCFIRRFSMIEGL